MSPFADPISGIQRAPTQDNLSLLTDPSRPPSVPRGLGAALYRPCVPRYRRKSYNDDKYIIRLLDQLNDVGKLAARDYSGTTEEDRLILIMTWIEHYTLRGQHPLVREGERGRRNGGGTFKCTECQKEYATLQKAMAHIFGDWKLSLWRCTMDECTRKYRSLNELRRHQKESHQVLLPREQKRLVNKLHGAHPSPVISKKHDKRPSISRDYHTNPPRIVPSPTFTPSPPTPVSNPMPSQPISDLSSFSSSPMYLGNDSEDTMAAPYSRDPMIPGHYLVPPTHDMIDAGLSGYVYYSPTTTPTPTPEFQVHGHYQPPVDPIDAHQHYEQQDQSQYDLSPSQYAITSTFPEYTTITSGFRQGTYLPNQSEQPSHQPSSDPYNGVQVCWRKAPRRSSLSSRGWWGRVECGELRPRASISVTNPNLALVLSFPKRGWQGIYCWQTLVMPATRLSILFLPHLRLSALSFRFGYSQGFGMDQKLTFDYFNQDSQHADQRFGSTLWRLWLIQFEPGFYKRFDDMQCLIGWDDTLKTPRYPDPVVFSIIEKTADRQVVKYSRSLVVGVSFLRREWLNTDASPALWAEVCNRAILTSDYSAMTLKLLRSL